MLRQALSFGFVFCLTVMIVSIPAFHTRSLAQDVSQTTEQVQDQLQPQTSEQQAIVQAYLQVVQQNGGSSAIQVSKVAIVEGYSLIEWSEEDGGGDCLLKKVGDQWTVVRGTGGAFSASYLTKYLQVPSAISQELVQKLRFGS